MVCCRCNIDKPLTEFHRENHVKNNGYKYYCKDCGNKVSKKYYHSHKESQKKSFVEWKKNNKEKWREMKRVYEKNKRKENVQYRILSGLRTRMRRLVMNEKALKSISLIGCDSSFLKGYLEGKFQEGMSWSNYGVFGWHIDHVIPCSAFDLSKKEEQKKCFHYTNLQPLWAKDNLRKGEKYAN